MDELLRMHVIFNDKADHFAKQGAKVHPGPSEEVSTKWQSDLADLQSYAKLLVTLWTLWPKRTKVEPRPKTNLQQGNPKLVGPGVTRTQGPPSTARPAA